MCHRPKLKNNTKTAYAEQNGIAYYNLCTYDNYFKIGASLPEENVVEHENIWGAIKMSSFIGGILRDEYGIQSVTDEQYENTRDYFEMVKSCAYLSEIEDPAEYLSAINDPDYAVIFAGHGNFDLEDNVRVQLSALGTKSKR